MSFFKKLFGKPEKPTSTSSSGLDGSDGNAILQFQKTILKPLEWEELKGRDFAMWLPSEKDTVFSNSKIVEKWNAIIGLTSKHWTYITADLLKLLKEIEESTMRMALPEENSNFPFLTSENEHVILSLSTEKGIRFHFSSTTSLEYRLQFLESFLTYCKGWNQLLTKLDQTADDNLEFDQWWALTLKASKTAEMKEPIQAVGKIVFINSQNE